MYQYPAIPDSAMGTSRDVVKGLGKVALAASYPVLGFLPGRVQKMVANRYGRDPMGMTIATSAIEMFGGILAFGPGFEAGRPEVAIYAGLFPMIDAMGRLGYSVMHDDEPAGSLPLELVDVAGKGLLDEIQRRKDVRRYNEIHEPSLE